MAHNVCMALEEAQATIEQMVNQARAELYLHRQGGGTDNEFIERLVNSFIAAHQTQNNGTGLIHMALSIYRMVIQQEQIWELNDAVEMRDSALKTLWEIEEL